MTQEATKMQEKTSTLVSKVHETIPTQYYVVTGAPIRIKWYIRCHIRNTDSIAVHSIQRFQYYDRRRKTSYV